MFFRWRHGSLSGVDLSNIINSNLQFDLHGNGSVACIGHFRHHWVAMLFAVTSEGDRSITVFDSAPSPMVHRDIARLTHSLGWPSATFAVSPRQARFSEECGLFAAACVLYLRAGRRPPPHNSIVSLHELRPLLANKDKNDTHVQQQRFLALADQLFMSPPAATPAPTGGNEQPAAPQQQDAHEPADTPPLPRCSASTQAKRGAKQCGNTVCAVVQSLGLCKLHLLLANTGSTPCSATSKAGNLCTHHAVRDLHRCAFHVSDAMFESWAPSLLRGPAPASAAENADARINASEHIAIGRDNAAADPTTAKLLDAVAAVGDPDLEDEILQWHFEFQQHTHDLQQPKLDMSRASLGALRQFLRLRGTACHPLALMKWQRPTLMGHARAIKKLVEEECEASLLQAPMVHAILEIMSSNRKRRHWSWTSMLRNMAELAGALRNLPVSCGIGPIQLADDPQWVAALHGVAGRAKAERPRVPTAIRVAEIIAAIRAEPRRAVKLLLALTWLVCGRTGDCRQLSPGDLALSGDNLTVTFRHGKTIARRGPYSLHTVFPPGWRELLDIQDGDTSWASILSSASVSDVLTALRRISTKLENRSIRRGALQCLAENGTPEELLLLFSGHTTVATLRRYLNWGTIGTHKLKSMTAAAKALGEATSGGGGAVRTNNPYAKVVFGSGPPPSYDSSTRYQASAVDKLGREHERWLQHLGFEAPPTAALPLAKPMGDPNDLPLMSKAVAANLNVLKLSAIAVASMTGEVGQFSADERAWSKAIPPTLASAAHESFRWLYDESKYQQIMSADMGPKRVRTRATCRLKDEDVEMQLKLKKYCEAPHDAEARILMWCRIFGVPEWHKDPPRRRHIGEPLINDKFNETPTIHFRGRHERHTIIGSFGGGYACLMDLASYFDQFSLDPKVRKFFGVRHKQRDLQMAVLPMGFRPSAQVAQMATWLLVAGLENADVKIITYIDNILILGRTREMAEHTRSIIRHRAGVIGAEFNLEGLDAPACQQFEFLGEYFDISKKNVTRSLSKKTLTKLGLLEEETLFAGAPMSCRQLAAVVGLLLFASGSGLPKNQIYKHYVALRYFRQQLCFVNGKVSSSSWDTTISFPPKHVVDDFVDWLRTLKENIPVHLGDSDQYEPPTDVIFTDACETGWGALHIRRDGSIEVVGDKWRTEELARWNMASSVASEPMAIAKALCRCISADKARTNVIVYTDHSPIVPAILSDCARAFSYHVLQCTINGLRLNPLLRIGIRHIPGLINPADGKSRNNDDDDSWRKIMGEALKWHGDRESKEMGESGCVLPEWAATASNPYRTL